MPNRSLSIVLFAAPLTAATAHAQTFGPPQRFITPGVLSPTAIDTADLDGDGRPDLVCSGAGDDRVVWFPNLATGGFGVARVITAQADGASCVVAADLDQDGDVDVVASSAEDDTVAWFENDGTGNAWTEHVVSSQTLGAADVFVADVNGDGTLDILTAAKDEGTLAWHENLGGGSFSSRNLLSISMPGIELVAALDLDGDGDLEVLCATGWNAPSWVFENLGAGAFAPEDQLTGQGGHMHIVRIADMDGDGDDDLLTSIQDTFGYDQVLWMENDGSGGFGAWHQVGDYLDTAYLVEPTDFDEDGDLDIVHVRGEPFYHYPGNIGWYENLGGGVFAPDRELDVVYQGADCFVTADVDGDGDDDLLTALRHNDLVAWHENLGNRRIDHQRVISSGPWARIGELTDLDQDGDLDAPMSLPLSSGFAWLPSFGSGAFSKPTTVDVEYGYTGGVVMDLDSDAHPDIVFSGATEPGSIDWSRGTSDGPTTTPVPLVDSEVQLRNLTAADLDGDGDSDLLGTAYLDGRVFAFENLGGGQLAAQRVIATLGGDYAYIEKSVDFDLDGDVDLLVRQGFQARLILLENDGSGRIVARHALPTLSDSVVSLGLADLDGDSDPDLYYTGYYEGRFAWLENLGFGRFAAERALWTQDAGVWYATTGDLDADGEPDIVFSANDEAMVGAVMNLGGGQFGPERVLWVGDSGVEPYNAVLGDVHVVDVDQDGDADIVSNGSFHHPLFWLENRTDLVGTVRCSGDDADALDCPCGNQSGSGTSEGCRNSTGRGARLFAHGTTDLATDDLRLRITRAPSHGAAMFVQGESLVTAPFRDGVLCAGNPVARLQVVPVDAEGGGLTTVPIGSTGAIPAPGSVRVYQAWYRDPLPSPCGMGSNLTNALEIRWQ